MSCNASQSFIRLQVEGIGGSPAPIQVLIARLRRIESLLLAYSGLTDPLDTTDLRRIGEPPAEEWVFNLSLTYAGTLNLPDWQRLHRDPKDTGGRTSRDDDAGRVRLVAARHRAPRPASLR